MSFRTGMGMLLLVIIALMSACQRDAGDFLQTVNKKYPLKSDRVSISKVQLDGQTLDSTGPVHVKPNAPIRLTADVGDGTWTLGQLSEFVDGAAATPKVAGVRPKPKDSDRMMSFMAFVRTPADLATPLHKEPKIMFFRFKPDGQGAELSATLTTPKTPGKCTVDIYCVDMSGLGQNPEENLNPIFRCLLDVDE